MTPNFSVVIPTYNRSSLAKACVESVMAMNLPDTEIVVVDDGSTDDTATVIREFGNGVRYIAQANAGPSAARNAGAAISRGEYLAFLDSDDSWISGGPQRLLDTLHRHRGIRAIFADARMGNSLQGFRSFVEVFGGGEFDRFLDAEIEPDVWSLKRRDFFQHMVVRNAIFPGTVFWRRQTFDRLGGFDASIRFAEDWELSMRLVATTELAYFSGGPVAVYNWHTGDRLTSHAGNMSLGYIAALESVLRKTTLDTADRASVREMLKKHLANRAHDEFVGGDLGLARGRYLHWLRRFGFDRRIAMRWLVSHAPRSVVEFARGTRRGASSNDSAR